MTDRVAMGLVIDGAPRTFSHEWPVWPRSSPEVEAAVIDVLRSGRWAISGMNAGHESAERRFGRKFAAYIGVAHGVPVTNGSAALVTALEAAGVSYGDEVLVPGLAWVACASAVARVGAVPMFVDIDETAYAMDPESAATLVSSRTAAVLVTHLSSSIADVNAFSALARQHGLVVIEDCSQAHGAVWEQRRVGSFGQVAAFSFQSSKLLTAGEGGIAVTDDDALADRAQQLRADGRRWASARSEHGYPDLEAAGHRQGHNRCMTEMQAAILSEALCHLDEQNQRRLRAVDHLERELDHVEGVATVRRRGDERVDVPTFWHLPIRIETASFGGAPTEWVRSAVSAELGLFLEPVGEPMPEHVLYQPLLYTRFPEEHVRRLRAASRVDLPGAAALSSQCFTVPHHALLAEPHLLDGLVEALVHVQRHTRERNITERWQA